MANKMALEKKIDLLVDKVEGLSTTVEAMSTHLNSLDGHVVAIKGEVVALKDETGGLRGEVVAIKGEMGELKSRVSVGFEESHRLLKLSLEGLGALEETTVARFDKMTDEHANRFDLLEKFAVHVRRRVERLEAPAPRRRR